MPTPGDLVAVSNFKEKEKPIVLDLAPGTGKVFKEGVEEFVEPPYLYNGWVDYRIKLPDGRETAMRVRSHGFKGWRQRYDRIEAVMGGKGISLGKVLSADCFLLEASVFWQKAYDTLKGDPLYFIDRIT